MSTCYAINMLRSENESWTARSASARALGGAQTDSGCEGSEEMPVCALARVLVQRPSQRLAQQQRMDERLD
eukprot:6195715-Pleurochrysis_carterae.AAC.1